MACCSFIAALMVAIASWKEIFVRDDRALLHVFLPPWKPSDPVSHSQPDGLPGLKWRPGPQLLAYGLDPATSSTCMLEGMDLVRMNLSEGGVPTPALRMNFSSDTTSFRHRRTVMKQKLEGLAGRVSTPLRANLEAGKAALDDVLGFQAKGYHSTEPHFPKQVQLIVPARAAEPGKNETALGAYLHTAVSGGNRRFFPRPGHKRNIGALRRPRGIAFFKGDAYIVDQDNHRILKVSPGNSEAEVFFGGKGRGSDLDQLYKPSGIAFFEEKAYIVDKYNHRILKFSPANSEAEVFFGGKGKGSDLDQLSLPSGIAFFEEKAYIVDYLNHRILKVSPANSEAEVFFGGKGKGSDLDQLSSQEALAAVGLGVEGLGFWVLWRRDSWPNRTPAETKLRGCRH